MEFIIKSEDSGITIKDFLRREINPSRKLLNLTKNKPDGILVNGERVTVRYILKSGDILNFNYADYGVKDGGLDVPHPNADLLDLVKIAYEDDSILCVNKPPNMPSHPSFNHLDDTLANAVAAYYLKHNIILKFHPVNRLDRNTSGLVLIAKDRLICPKLNELIKRGEIKKSYIAIVIGDFNNINPIEILEYNPVSRTGSIKAPIKREQDSIIKRICAPDGDHAITEFKFIKSNGEISLLEVYPITGRTHQIRVHFQAIGFSLLGDDLYYNNLTAALSDKYNISRHALHAASLEFKHPVSQDNIKIECAAPDDIQEILKIF